MSIGKFRHRVTLQAFTDVQDATTGALSRTWADVAEVWADVRFLSGLETVKAATELATTRCSMRIRYRAGVEEKMRVRYESRDWDIQAVLPDPTGRRYIDLACETGANSG